MMSLIKNNETNFFMQVLFNPSMDFCEVKRIDRFFTFLWSYPSLHNSCFFTMFKDVHARQLTRIKFAKYH